MNRITNYYLFNNIEHRITALINNDETVNAEKTNNKDINASINIPLDTNNIINNIYGASNNLFGEMVTSIKVDDNKQDEAKLPNMLKSEVKAPVLQASSIITVYPTVYPIDTNVVSNSNSKSVITNLLSAEQKVMNKRAKNRMHAKASRDRLKKYVISLEQENKRLDQENKRLASLLRQHKIKI